MGGRPWRDVPHAQQGDLRRLPLLPGARSPTAPGRRGLAAGDPGCATGAARYANELGLSAYDASVLVGDPDATRLFEATLAAGASADSAPGVDAKHVANWVTGEYLRLRNAAEGHHVVVEPNALATLIRLVADGSINRTSALEVLEEHATSSEAVAAIVERLGLSQISDTDALGRIVDEVIAANADAVADVRAGKGQAIGFLVGQVMKATRGQANAAVAQAALRTRLGEDT